MKFLNDALRFIVGFFDTLIYGLVSWVLQGIFDLANSQIFSQTVIDDFARRIYIILGLIMIFKIILSFLQILINPDVMNDKDKGAFGVLKRVIVALLLIVFVPTIFKTARQLQQYIIPIIPRVFLGVSENDVEEVSNENNDSSSQNGNSLNNSRIGDIMAWYSFTPFFEYDNYNCADGSLVGSAYDFMDIPKTSHKTIDSVSTAFAANRDMCEYSTQDPQYRYKYKMGLSTLVGAYLVYVLVNVAVKIAIRTVKLSICEFASPIPIASYIDPKSSEKTFKKWMKLSFNLYLELYIHLIVVYFVIYVFLTFCNSDSLFNLFGNLGGDFWRCSFVILFVIVGLLTFAKDAPKFLSDLLGIDTSGAFGSIFKPDGWKAIGSTATTIGAPLATGIANWINGHNSPDFDAGRTARSVVAGFASSAFHGTRAALKGENAKGIIKAGHSRAITARQNRTLDRLNDVRLRDKIGVQTRDFLGLDTKMSLAEGRLKAAGEVKNDIATVKSKRNAVLEKKGNRINMNNSNLDIRNELDTIFYGANGDAIMFSDDDFLLEMQGKYIYGHDISYADLLELRNRAANKGIGTIAISLSNESETMKNIQSILWDDPLVRTDKEVLNAESKLQNTISKNGSQLDDDAHLYPSVNDMINDVGTTRGLKQIEGIAQDTQNKYAVNDEARRRESEARASIARNKNNK